MGTLKRMEIDSLKQGAKKGQKVLITWDRDYCRLRSMDAVEAQ